MKKITFLFCVIIVSFTLTACGSEQRSIDREDSLSPSVKNDSDIENTPNPLFTDIPNTSGIIGFEYTIYDEFGEVTHIYSIEAIDDNVLFAAKAPNVDIEQVKLENNVMERLIGIVAELKIEQWLLTAADEPMKHKINIKYANGLFFSIEEPSTFHAEEHQEISSFFQEILDAN